MLLQLDWQLRTDNSLKIKIKLSTKNKLRKQNSKEVYMKNKYRKI